MSEVQALTLSLDGHLAASGFVLFFFLLESKRGLRISAHSSVSSHLFPRKKPATSFFSSWKIMELGSENWSHEMGAGMLMEK